MTFVTVYPQALSAVFCILDTSVSSLRAETVSVPRLSTHHQSHLIMMSLKSKKSTPGLD